MHVHLENFTYRVYSQSRLLQFERCINSEFEPSYLSHNLSAMQYLQKSGFIIASTEAKLSAIETFTEQKTFWSAFNGTINLLRDVPMADATFGARLVDRLMMYK